jgi:hypothetical protein
MNWHEMGWGPASCLMLSGLLMAGGLIAGLVAYLRAEADRKRREARRLGIPTIHIYTSNKRHSK